MERCTYFNGYCLWDKTDRLAAFGAERVERQEKNIVRLRQNQEALTLPRSNTRVVYNLSDRQLSKAAEQVLSKGFNYAIALNKLLPEEIVCGVENAVSILESNIAETKEIPTDHG
ncbi:hypothetical protein Trydic_g18795 [Trypoxylus dichotomus]